MLASVAVTLALGVGNPAVCGGWLPTPEARMACCTEGAGCPMHEGRSQASGSHHSLTQAEADACCAASEGQPSSSSTPSLVRPAAPAVLGDGTPLPPSVPALVLSDGWRTTSPLPATPVPRHLLLSVFLV